MSIVYKENPIVNISTEGIQQLPLAGGTFGMALITEVTQEVLDLKDPTGFIFTDGTMTTLAHNYVMVFTHPTGEVTAFRNVEELIHAIPLEPSDIDAFTNYLTNMHSICTASIGTYMYKETTYLPNDETGEPDESKPIETEMEGMFFYNLYEEGQMMGDIEGEIDPQQQSIIDSHINMAMITAKLAEMIQKRYNQINFDDKAKLVAQFITEITYIDDNGDVVPLSITGIENFFSKVKGNIRIGTV